MTYDLNKIETDYNIKLDEEQRNALSSLISFIYSKKQCICLTGNAGTSKSTILSIIYDILSDNGYCCTFVTPTNKAKIVIENKGEKGRAATTIHSLLNLKPNLNILDFDASDMIFESSSPFHVDFDILLVDECSMINDELYKVLLKKYKNRKIIFCGDPKQLYSVKQRHISLPFTNDIIELHKIYRQPDSILNKTLDTLRHNPIYHFIPESDDYSNIEIYSNIVEMLNKYSYLYKLSKDFNQLSIVKLVTYTNKRIQILNKTIRYLLKYKQEYVEGDILTGYYNCNFNNVDIENSEDYIVCDNPKPCILNNMKAWGLTLQSSYSEKFKIKILSRDNSPESFYNLGEQLEILRLKAVKSKLKSHWRDYFKFNSSFLTPIDIIYDGRIVKRKSLDYGYCISAHKSQGSEYQIVMVDSENLKRCPNKEELRQLQYVACSRTKGTLIIYQK